MNLPRESLLNPFVMTPEEWERQVVRVASRLEIHEACSQGLGVCQNCKEVASRALGALGFRKL